MKFSPAIVYSTGHVLNEKMSATLATGFRAEKRAACFRNVHATVNGATYEFIPVSPRPDTLTVVYGILRGTGEILKECERGEEDYIYCDHSYFDACRSNIPEGKLDGYFRLVPNDRYFRHGGEMPADRWDALRIRIKPWRKAGKHIVVIPVSKFVAEYRWLKDTVEELRRYTDRRIIIKPKDADQPFAAVLENAWAVVTLESNSAVQAVIDGIPAFTSTSAAAAPMACQDFSLIENPPLPEREQHLWNLAYGQFNRNEISDGSAAGILKEQADAGYF